MANTHSATLNGTSQWFTAEDSASLSITGDMTVEGWIKPVYVAVGYKGFVTKYEYTGNQRSWYFLYRTLTVGDGEILFGVYNTGTTGTDSAFPAIPMSAGTWYHWAIVYTAAAATADLYVNGVFVAQSAMTRTAIFDSTAKLCIGNSNPVNDPSSPATAQIDEVRIWNVARTAAQIYDNVGVQIDSATGLVASYHLDNALTDSSGNSNTLTNIGSTPFTTDVPFPPFPYSILYSLVSYWKMDEASGTRIDIHANNDITDNNTVGSATGKINNAADFERDNSEYLSITDAAQRGLDITGDMSISVWVKFESLPTTVNSFAIVSKIGATRAYFLNYDNSWHSGANRLYFQTAATPATGTRGWTSWTPTLDVWYHIAVTHARAGNGTHILYINGVSQSITYDLQDAGAIQDSSVAYLIGAEDDSGVRNFFDGLIDEVGIWNRVLASTEITQLYNAGAGLAYPLTPAAAPASPGKFFSVM